MADTSLIQQGLKKFSSLKKWDLPSLQLLNTYLLDYEGLPSYKKLLFSMILYDDMYRPIKYSHKTKIYNPRLRSIEAEENMRRTEKRARIYMNKRKLIRTHDEKGEKCIVVTSTGEKIFYESYPLAKLRKQKWDGMWTIVMYDFPEKKRLYRKHLRDDLVRHGFGSPQQSIYISPLSLAKPIQQHVDTESYQEYVWITRSERVWGKSNTEIARDTWPLEVINDQYRRLYESFVLIAGDELLETFWKSCFLAIDNKNPYLPNELLPEDWYEDDCRKIFRKLSRQTFLDAILG